MHQGQRLYTPHCIMDSWLLILYIFNLRLDDSVRVRFRGQSGMTTHDIQRHYGVVRQMQPEPIVLHLGENNVDNSFHDPVHVRELSRRVCEVAKKLSW
jgi:hypothetical protein